MVCFDCPPTTGASVHTHSVFLTLALACERSLTNERRPQESLTEVASGTHKRIAYYQAELVRIREQTMELAVIIGYVQGKSLA